MSNAPKPERYLVILQGGGDTVHLVLTKAQWDSTDQGDNEQVMERFTEFEKVPSFAKARAKYEIIDTASGYLF